MKNLILLCVVVMGCATRPMPLKATSLSCRVDWSQVQVLEVLDGDTFAIDVPQLPPLFGERLSVRLRGIETASLHGRAPCEKKMALRAKQELEDLIERGDYWVWLTDPERGKFFRIISGVEADGVDVIEHLLDNNLGVEYHGGTKPKINWCELWRQVD